MEPLRKALLLPRVNLFIADDVGLGKTIEAGLIIRELLMRQKVKRIVVARPASVLLQWRDELESRFGLTFGVLDREYVLRCRRERGYGVNPWSTHTRFIVSHSLLRDETYAGPLRDWLETQGAPTENAVRRYSRIVNDPCHPGMAALSDDELTAALKFVLSGS